jgi:hypothetical protein
MMCLNPAAEQIEQLQSSTSTSCGTSASNLTALQ